MARSFADDLLQFARTVDIVNTEIFDHARTLVEKYLKDALNINYFEFMRETVVSGCTGLETVWATSQKHSEPIKSPDGNYTNQICFAFDERIPLWVVGKDKAPLIKSEAYMELWSGRDSLPKYAPVEGYEIRTAIIIPVRKKGGSLLGVLDLESVEYLDITETAKNELSLISEAIGLLSEREAMIANDTADTKTALRNLENSFGSKSLLRLSKPQLFFAWPSKADQSVIAAIRTALDGFSDRVKIITWDEIEISGNINDQIIEHLLGSTYGVCYFSEPSGADADSHYVDNANVLIEAGMLHVLSQHDQSSAAAWIPVREQEPPPIPFDFIAQRILTVPRLQSGELNEKLFVEQLRKRIESLLTNK